MSRGPRALHITNIPTPYRIPQLNEVHRQLREIGWEYKVIFGAATYSRRKWKVDLSTCTFDYVILPSKRFRLSHEKTLFLYSGLYRELRAWRPDVITVTGFSPAAVKLWALSWVRRMRYMIYSGSVRREGAYDSFWRRLQRRSLARRAVGGVAYGSRSKEYLIGLGLEAERVFTAINTVDTAYFRVDCSEEAPGAVSGAASGAKRELLYVGHVTRGKRLDLLLRALRLLAARRNDFVLRIVGDGPEVESVARLAREMGLTEVVRFEGFRQQPEVRAYLRDAACLVFPSEYDVWGLVLNEAMAAGVPCIASVYAGATVDLIEDGVTGFAADFSDTERVAEHIAWILDHPEQAHHMGKAAADFIAEHASLERSAAGFVHAYQDALRDAPPPRPVPGHGGPDQPPREGLRAAHVIQEDR